MFSNWLLVMVLANEAAPAAPPPPPREKLPTSSNVIMDVTDDPGRVVERNGVRWREWVFMRPADEPTCGTTKSTCRSREVAIYNESRAVLRCRAAIHYAQPNEHGIPDAARRIVVPSGKGWAIVRSEEPVGLQAERYETDCTAEPPLAPLDKPAHCTLKVLASADPDSFYPESSKQAMEEGPVFLEFSLAASPGHPKDIAVIQTSTYPELDAAAARTAAASKYETNCPGQRFRIMVSFKVQ